MSEKTEQIIKQIKKSLCKIKVSDDKIGTGFFCKINIPNRNSFINTLITNNQILSQNDILPGKTVNLTLSDGQKIDITIDSSYKTYTDINFDTTIIQLKMKNIIPLVLDAQIFNKDANTIYNEKSVFLFDFSDDSKKIYSVGKIQNIDQNYIIESLCFNKRPSLGGPMVNTLNNRIIGIHRGSKNGLNWKFGTFIRGPIEAFIYKNNLNNIQQSNQNMISYLNKTQYMNNNTQNQIMNNGYYIAPNNIMNSMNVVQQNPYMSSYSNMNNMQNNIGYNNSMYVNMNHNSNNIGINQYNQFPNNNNNNAKININNNLNYLSNKENNMNSQNQIINNLNDLSNNNNLNSQNQINNNLNNLSNKENNMNYQNPINKNINTNYNKKEQKDIYEDIYSYIEGEKINIIFKIFEHTEKRVKIPSILNNIELYFTADIIKHPLLYELTDVTKIKLYLNNKEIKYDKSKIGLKNEDIVVIKDITSKKDESIKSKNNKKLNIFFNYSGKQVCKMIFPTELTLNKMLMEFFSKNNIQESNKIKFIFKYQGNFLDINRKDKLTDYKLRNNSTIEISIKNDSDKKFSYSKKRHPGMKIKPTIRDENNKIIVSNFVVGTLQKVKDFYEDLKGEISDKITYISCFEKIVINEVEFKINNKKINDERSFLSIGIRKDFTCKVFTSRNLMSNKNK